MENEDASEVRFGEKEPQFAEEIPKQEMSTYEKRSLRNNKIQTFILFLGVISASIFGYYQVKINSYLFEFNKMSLDLLLFPSLDGFFQ